MLTYLLIPSFWFFLFKVKFKYPYCIKEIECQRINQYWKLSTLTAYGCLTWALNIVSFRYRMLPFYMALVWSTSITMPFSGKLE